MSLPGTLPRVAAAMTPGALTVVEHDAQDEPWRPGLLDVIRRHSRHPSYNADFSLVDALSASGLWTEAGRVRTAAVPFSQRVTDYIERLHSTSSLARELMPTEEVTAFDRAIADLVLPHATTACLS